MPNLTRLQEELNYKFVRIELLKQALTHRSSSSRNYERLEFVGDGILDYVIAVNLFHKYPNLAEGELSKMRSALVNQDTLVDIAGQIKLGQYLSLGDGEEKSGGRTRPSILADSLEAIFAAISFDSDFVNAKLTIEALYKDKLQDVDMLVLKDSKSLLQEYLQARKLNPPEYRIVAATGPDHDSVFCVECVVKELDLKILAKGKSKKEASRSAAAKALQLINKKNQNN